LIRVLFVVLAILGGSGLVLYVAMWIIIPKEP
jgi:phage shock protein PspC (stress-responsive transcriptional regulator)